MNSLTTTMWLSRCVPGLSLVALLVFLEFTLGVLQSAYHNFFSPAQRPSRTAHPILLWIFLLYSLVLHLMSWIFPLRLCWATWKASSAIKEAHEDFDNDIPPLTLQSKRDVGHYRDASVGSLGTEEASVIMAIIIPSYKEDISTLEDTLAVLASHSLARECYDICLAMEQRDPNASRTAHKLLQLFRQEFLSMRFTVHPAGIEGEAPGKSSNVSWAAKEIDRVYENKPQFRNVLITTMDCDTHLMPQYFERLRTAHLRVRQAGNSVDMTLYMPPIIFDRNAHSVPMLVRVADLMWCGAGLSCFQPKATTSGVGVPTAVYTIPLTLAHFVHGWDTDPGSIGEDMHMMLKCYFATNGKLQIESIPSPASQCNISVTTRGIRGWLDNHRARYNQGLRHMWGCLDTGFAVRQWCSMSHQTVTPSSPDPMTSHQRPRKPSQSEHFPQHQPRFLNKTSHPSSGRFSLRTLTVFTRLFEAHFLPLHLFIILLASSVFAPGPVHRMSPLTVPYTSYTLYPRLILDLTASIRALSYATMVVYFIVIYTRYHDICLSARQRELDKAGLLQARLSDQISPRGRWSIKHWAECLVFPVGGMLFGSVCLLQAVLSHFWTDRLVYLVSAKPVRGPSPSPRSDSPVGNGFDGGKVV